jgi:hypothetical protein
LRFGKLEAGLGGIKLLSLTLSATSLDGRKDRSRTVELEGKLGKYGAKNPGEIGTFKAKEISLTEEFALAFCKFTISTFSRREYILP